jgi:anaerobic ribonucleoside-triphosphate reductase activating protein
MRISKIIHGCLAEGPSPRTVIWFQGCPIRCPGCYNSHLWPFDGGQEMPLADVLNQVKQGHACGDVGVSLVGGEPLAQPEACAELCAALHEIGIHIIVYSGLAYDDIVSLVPIIPAFQAILNHADVLVDGPFIRSEYDPAIAYRGSRNQRVIDLHTTRERGRLIALDQEWDRRLAITIRPGGALVMPARVSPMFAGSRARARNCGQTPSGVASTSIRTTEKT